METIFCVETNEGGKKTYLVTLGLETPRYLRISTTKNTVLTNGERMTSNCCDKRTKINEVIGLIKKNTRIGPNIRMYGPYEYTITDYQIEKLAEEVVDMFGVKNE